ncbi:MAG: hypothetical protein SWN98_17520 [Pseudomonadota bacterium]|nr:hypothetical protein [Pseudomonadota bacterium]
MAQKTFTVESSIAELPIQPEIVRGAVLVPGFPALGRIEQVVLNFTTEMLGQALVVNYGSGYGYGGLSSNLAVEFSPGSQAPEFDDVVVSSSNIGPEAFMAPYGYGLPYTYALQTTGPLLLEAGLAQPKAGFEVNVAVSGLHSPTFNGAPTFASMSVDSARVFVTASYSYGARTYSNGDNKIAGTKFDDFVDLGGGDDNFTGKQGNDAALGGKGDDRLEGGKGADVLRGGGSRDVLLGGGGKDKLDGGKGSDTLTGGKGNDRMSGGAGADSFVLHKDNGQDVIQDFDPAEDRLLLESGLRKAFKSATVIAGDLHVDLPGASDLILRDVTNAGQVLETIEIL